MWLDDDTTWTRVFYLEGPEMRRQILLSSTGLIQVTHTTLQSTSNVTHTNLVRFDVEMLTQSNA